MTETNPRRVAAQVLKRVVEDRAFSPIALMHGLNGASLEPRDRAFVTHLVYGTLTYLGPIDEVLNIVARDGLASLHADLRAILRLATYELHYQDNAPHHAILNEAGTAARDRFGKRYTRVVNGILRRITREEGELFAPASDAPADVLATVGGLPGWLAEKLVFVLGDEAAYETMQVLNAPAPTHFRVRFGHDADQVIAALTEAGFTPEPHPTVPGVWQTRGHLAGSAVHRAGQIAIQDAGAQAALQMLPDELDGTILDACAGLGGKTLALLDRYPRARVISSDLHAKKLRKIPVTEAEEERHGAVAWDMREPAPSELVAAGTYDAVVVDAPCSALGTIGRHPEARWTRSQDDVTYLAELQAKLLDNAAPLVAPGGVLLYIVCTWTPEESAYQVERFLERHPAFRVDTTGASPATRQLWPHVDQTEGFFAARFVRAQPSE